MAAARSLLTLGPILRRSSSSGAVLLALGVDPLALLRLRAAARARLALRPAGDAHADGAAAAASRPSLIVAFRAGIWNLGGDGQFLLGAVIAAATAPALAAVMPGWLMLVLCLRARRGWSAPLWSLVPALLRAYQGVNEIITTLMMTFLGVSLRQRAGQARSSSTPPRRCRRPARCRSRTACRGSSAPPCRAGCLIGLVAIIVVHLDDDAHGLRPEAAGRRRQSARRRPCRPAGAAPDGRRLRASPRRWPGSPARSRSSACRAMCGPTGTRPTD